MEAETKKCHSCWQIKPIAEYFGELKKEKIVNLCWDCRLRMKVRMKERKQKSLEQVKDNEKSCIQCLKVLPIDQYRMTKEKILSEQCIECLERKTKNRHKRFREDPEKKHKEYANGWKRTKERLSKFPELVEKRRQKMQLYYDSVKGTDKQHYHSLKTSAKSRNLILELTFEYASELRHRSCHYCGDKGPVGIDRKDNLLSYTVENSIPCCITCNRMKLDWEYDGFLLMMGHISAFNGLDGKLCKDLLPRPGSSEYYHLTSAAKKRNLAVELTKDQYNALKTRNCYICNRPGPVGIDRKNNELGYIEGNCFPCCGVCNVMKLDYKHEDFLQKCQQIYRFNKDYLESCRIYETRTEQIVRKRRKKQKTE